MSAKIGLGISTFNRPDFFGKAVQGISEQLGNLVDYVVAYNDGSDTGLYDEVYSRLPQGLELVHSITNSGVAAAKNALFKKMLDNQCDYLFLMEDDIIPIHPNAITRYIAAEQSTQYEHFNFAHHGPGNARGPIREENGLAYYPCTSGAWSLYTRNVIETVGLMDENFYNAMEHMEHTSRALQKQV